MTDFDKKLIEKAKTIMRWDYRIIDALTTVADTRECRMELREIRAELYESVMETL